MSVCVGGGGGDLVKALLIPPSLGWFTGFNGIFSVYSTI